jgi:hypothetical protein
VVARVNGEEITKRDLLVELHAIGAPADMDVKAVQRDFLDQIINRKLLVAEARRRHLDLTPDYLAALRRNRELLLSSRLTDKLDHKPAPISQREIRRFIAENPEAFADREILEVERVELAASPLAAKIVGGASSLNEAIRRLAQARLTFQRVSLEVDMGIMKQNVGGELRASPKEIYISSADGVMRLDEVQARRSAPIIGSNQERIAREYLKKKDPHEFIGLLVTDLRARSRIEYQPAFKPPL